MYTIMGFLETLTFISVICIEQTEPFLILTIKSFSQRWQFTSEEKQNPLVYLEIFMCVTSDMQ